MSDNSPGWYRDPAEPTTQRYWDGDGWVGDSLPIDAPTPDGPFVAPTAPAPPIPVTGPPLPPGVQAPPGWPTPPPVYPTPPVDARPPMSPYPTPPGTRPIGPTPPNWPAGLPNPYGPGGMPANPRAHGFLLAPLGSRFVARIVDIIAVLLLNVVLSWYLVLQYVHETGPYWRALMHAVHENNTSTANLPPMSSRGATLGIVILTFAVVIWGVYEVPSTGRWGQTFGKYLLGIRVIGLEGTTELGTRRAFRRWTPLGFGTLLWQCCGIGFVIQGIDCLASTINRPFKLALHDVYAATVVVEVPPKNSRPSPTDSPSDEQKSVNGGTR